MRPLVLRRSLLLACACAAVFAAGARAQPASPAAAPAKAPAAPLAPETADTAVLPPANAHRVWVADIYSGSARVLDGDTGTMLGTIQSASLATFAASPGQRTVYVAESIWTKGVRGTRQDMVTVYDGSTLNLKTEITIPGRIYMAPRPQLFELTAKGDTGYIYNLQPASSVILVDMQRQRVLRSIDVPGCALVYPWGERGFASLCGNGALATVTWDAKEPTLTRSEPFFDAEHDPVFQESPTDSATGRTLFVTYSGMVHPVQLNAAPKFDTAWSLQQAAGLTPASTQDGTLAWIPGGRVAMAWRRATGTLYVLMHAGEPWTHKKSGTELWVVDASTRKVLRRAELSVPASAVAVSQDDHPLLYLIDDKHTLSIRDAATLEELRKVEDVGSSFPFVPAM